MFLVFKMPDLPRSTGYNFMTNTVGSIWLLARKFRGPDKSMIYDTSFKFPPIRSMKGTLSWPSHIRAESDGVLIQIWIKNSPLSCFSCSRRSLHLVIKMNTYSDHSPESNPYGTRVKALDMCTFVFGHFRLKIQLDLAVRQRKSIIFPL